jgi:CrcB protein
LRLIFIAVGGAGGAVLRYLISGWAYTVLGDGFPWGTLVVNLLGSFLIGFLWQFFEYVSISPEMRSLIFIGGLGAFTTFSTLAFESLNLIRNGDITLGLLNIFIADIFGLFLVFLGIILGRYAAAAIR